MKEYLTAQEVADKLGVSLSWIRKLTSARAIPFYKMSHRKVLYRPDEIEAWMFKRHREPVG